MKTIQISEINSANIQAQGKIDGITEVELIGTNGKTGDEKTTAYWFGGVRVIDTNGDPIWEESDPDGFAAMINEIEEEGDAEIQPKTYQIHLGKMIWDTRLEDFRQPDGYDGENAHIPEIKLDSELEAAELKSENVNGWTIRVVED